MARNYPSKRLEEISRISDEIGRLTKRIVAKVRDGQFPSEEDKRKLEVLKEELARLSGETTDNRLESRSAQVILQAL